MPSYLDLGVLGVVFVSALLSMLRGCTREVLAIGSWAAAAAAAYYFYPYVLPHLQPFISKPILAQAASAAAVFFVTLIVVSLFTVRISDWILDSKVGALDRTLGFVFGAARGFLLAVVAFWIFNWLVGDKQQPEWVRDAKTRPALTETANRIIAMLPEDAATTLEGWVKSKTSPVINEIPPDEAATPPKPIAPAPAPAAPQRKTDSGSSSDKQKLDTILKQSGQKL